jgi:hypothetical protein
MNYPELHATNECPGRPGVMNNQGLASDWMKREMKKFQSSTFSKKA